VDREVRETFAGLRWTPVGPCDDRGSPYPPVQLAWLNRLRLWWNQRVLSDMFEPESLGDGFWRGVEMATTAVTEAIRDRRLGELETAFTPQLYQSLDEMLKSALERDLSLDARVVQFVDPQITNIHWRFLERKLFVMLDVTFHAKLRLVVRRNERIIHEGEAWDQPTLGLQSEVAVLNTVDRANAPREFRIEIIRKPDWLAYAVHVGGILLPPAASNDPSPAS